MASEMEWSHDFCLSCDRQIAEGAYCSQACRLADLEKAGTSDPAAPLPLSSSASSYGSSSAGFYLPPAVNFAAYKAPTASRPATIHYSPPSSPQYATANGSYFYQPTSNSQHKRSLTPSSSRTSLSSVSSSQTANGLTVQAANELNGYVRSFDRTRYERRSTVH